MHLTFVSKSKAIQMNNWLTQNGKYILLVLSTLVIALFLANSILMLLMIRPYSIVDIRYELEAILLQTPILPPAIIGLWKRNELIVSRGLLLGYGLYTLIIGYIYSAIIWASSPLEPGLAYIIVGLPIAIGLTLYLVHNIYSSHKTTS